MSDRLRPVPAPGLTGSLFDDADPNPHRWEVIEPGAAVWRGGARGSASALIAAVDSVLQRAAWRHMVTPGGRLMSVAMTNCGRLGWVSDRTGYRYDPLDPLTGTPWPAMPAVFVDLAREAATQAGFVGFEPDAALINRYEPGARLTLHQDRNERDAHAPIVLGLARASGGVSLGRADPHRRGPAHPARAWRRGRLGPAGALPPPTASCR